MSRLAQAAPMHHRDSFGPYLRRTRERRGVTLEHLAQRTKVSLDLWAALERGDLSRWPTGIFARAYIREYAELVGLNPTETIDDFCRLFSQVGDRRAANLLRAHGAIVGHDVRWQDDLVGQAAERDRRRRATDEPRDASAQARGWHPNWGRLLATVIDTSGVLAIAAAAAWLLRVDFWASVAAAGLIWNTIGVYGLGSTLGGTTVAWLGRLTHGVSGTRALLSRAGHPPAPTDA